MTDLIILAYGNLQITIAVWNFHQWEDHIKHILEIVLNGNKVIVGRGMIHV